MDRFEENEIKKIRPIKNTCYGWLINYILEPIRKSVGVFKGKVFSLFKTNTSKKKVYARGKRLSKPKTQNNIKNPIILKKKKNKDRIIRDIRTFFEQKEEDYCKPKRVSNFWCK